MATVMVIYALCLAVLIASPMIKVGKAQIAEEDQNCKADLLATGQYVLILKEQRDQCEKEMARLLYQVDRLTEENAKMFQKIEKEIKK